MSSRLYRLYNTKADEIVGYTYDGEAYCVECVNLDWYTISGDAPSPLFNSDEIPSDWECIVCEESLR